jgi:glycosyltransferase involved in cell wall biosynthesis
MPSEIQQQEKQDGPSVAARPRICILIVAYNAESTIFEVLSRIKPATWERITEVVVFDDFSRDSTSDEATRYRNQPYGEKIKVFRNQVNLGYGGNQKRGYLYAIKRGFDIVILLHGDGQYAPERIDDLIDPLAAGESEAVFGSRMMVKGAARRGGMPFYKWIGNRILTVFQNALLGARLSEYHSGYRAYHVPSLAHLPFLKNSNDFHFDNEIIIQFFEAGYRVKEVPIPTYYGDEICYVNGMKYAWDIVKTTIKYRLHKAGFLYYSQQFDLRAGEKYVYKQNRYSSHNQILDAIGNLEKKGELEALDVGCGSGFLAAKIAALGYRVTGVDVYDSEEARRNCFEFHVCDVERGFGPAAESRTFDVIVLADVLEHIRNPETILLRARALLKPGGTILASTGNVAHFSIRLSLLLGRFIYTERGILDRTHVRLFTRRTFRHLFRDCAFTVRRERGCPIPFEVLVPRRPIVSNFLCWLNMLLVRVWPSLWAYQTIVEAQADDRSSSALLRQAQIDSPYLEWEGPKRS